jgi:hypothetical protein
MPSARDLLQQADALMRSNRSVGASGGDETVPVLTDVVRGGEIPVLTNAVTRPGADSGLVHADRRDETRDESRADSRRFPPTQSESLLPLSEMPKLPEIPADDSIIAMRRSESRIDPLPDDEEALDERPKWLEADLLNANEPAPAPTMRDGTQRGETGGAPGQQHGDASGADGGPQPAMLAPADVEPDEIASLALAAVESTPDDAAAAATDAPPAGAPITEEVAEAIYFQVLQNLDLYTDRALQQHLAEHLPPIIEKASRELLAMLNENLGAVMRKFVADAIEKQLGVRPKAGDSPLA